MDHFLNYELLRHPANWLIIFLILYLVCVLARAAMSAAETGQLPFSLPSKV